MDGLPVIRMCQNGNHVIHPDLGELWNEPLTQAQKAEIMEHASKIWGGCTHQVPDEEDLFEDRGAQISLSLYGHHADPVFKRTFDPNFLKRKALLAQFPYESESTEVKIGGTTTFDYFPKGKNKGFNITRFVADMNWDKDVCLFFGDALFPGGNDETVVGVIETVSVKDPEDTYQKLRTMFL
jgi:hydroxymethylpyrimidine pyrophosphatase-like HAD family hydrolase